MYKVFKIRIKVILNLILMSVMLLLFSIFQSEVESWWYLVIPMGLVILFVFLLDFYIEAVAANHLQGPRTAVYGTYAIIISALMLGLTWNHPMVSWITTVTKDIITEDHVLSGGVIFSLMTFILGNYTVLGSIYFGFFILLLPWNRLNNGKQHHSTIMILLKYLKCMYMYLFCIPGMGIICKICGLYTIIH